MESIYWAHLVVVLCLGTFVSCLCQNDSDANFSAVYIVTLRQASAARYYGELTRDGASLKYGSSGRLNIHKPRYSFLCYY